MQDSKRKACEKPVLVTPGMLSKVTANDACASGEVWVEGDNGKGYCESEGNGLVISN